MTNEEHLQQLLKERDLLGKSIEEKRNLGEVFGLTELIQQHQTMLRFCSTFETFINKRALRGDEKRSKIDT